MPNQDNTALASQHYENFPVASFALPKDLRYPIALIYHFARCADDFADEDNHTQAERLALLQGYVDELNINLVLIRERLIAEIFRPFCTWVHRRHCGDVAGVIPNDAPRLWLRSHWSTYCDTGDR